MKLGLVADDLTGACDASVQFAKRGCETLLMLGFDRTGGIGQVLAVTTDSRALSNSAAEKLTCDAVLTLMAAGIDRIFLKIDSTMRGSVPGQITGALAAWQTRHPNASAVVCPAYPRMGRTVYESQLLVNGEPVDRTAIGRDPVSPVRTSNMSELIARSEAISTADATSDSDLRKLASTISDGGPSVVAVGSGGLAEAMADIWLGPVPAAGIPLPRLRTSRILIQVTSLNPVSHAQAAKLTATFPDIVVLLAPPVRVDAPIAENLAMRFADLVEREKWDLLGLVGGDGARAALARIGASAIRIMDSVLEGIPIGIVEGGTADGVPVFTKAGGFGDEDALVRLVEKVGM